MKWVLSQQSLDHHRWLLQDAKDEAQFTYNHEHHSIRLKGKNSRLFFLEVIGLFQKKIQLRSEYGVVVGQSTWPPENSDGSIQLNEEKYYFKWQQKTLSLFTKGKQLFQSIHSEHEPGLDKLEKFALVFSSLWLVNTSANASNKEDVLVA
jgi:hypothetical protein